MVVTGVIGEFSALSIIDCGLYQVTKVYLEGDSLPQATLGGVGAVCAGSRSMRGS